MAQRSPIIRLSEGEAWELLRGSAVGRLATVINRQPDIFPVNFLVEGSSVFVRTAEGSKLLQVTVNARVAFQSDGWVTDTGWSVVAKGTATEVEEADERDRIAQVLHPWVASVKTHVIRIDVDEIDGRRFVFSDEPEPDYIGG